MVSIVRFSFGVYTIIAAWVGSACPALPVKPSLLLMGQRQRWFRTVACRLLVAAAANPASAALWHHVEAPVCTTREINAGCGTINDIIPEQPQVPCKNPACTFGLMVRARGSV
jgi:hypothetical protein